jgi:hypothetical protein
MSHIQANRRLITLAASLGSFFEANIVAFYALSVPVLAAEFNVPGIGDRVLPMPAHEVASG